MQYVKRRFVSTPLLHLFGDSEDLLDSMSMAADLARFRTMEDTIVPLQFPVRDNTGALIRELPIAKGTAVYLGLAAANRSNTIWGPDATEYKPERWLGKLGREGTTDNNTRLPGIYSNM